MSHKTLVKVAILMFVVFGVITLTYPMIFTPDPQVPEALPEQQAVPPAQ